MITSSIKPFKVEKESLSPSYAFNFDIVEVDGKYHYQQAIVPIGQWDYPHLVAAIIRAKYSADDVEAILLNRGDGDPDHEAQYEELQQWRKHAKDLAKEVFV